MITISKKDEKLTFESWDFPAGEVGIRLDTNNLRYRYAEGPHVVIARTQKSRDVMELIMVVDALRRWDPRAIRLVIPCVPYARQDRVCSKGESLSLKAFAQVINGLGCEYVATFDQHSDVTQAVFDNLFVVDRATIIGKFDALNKAILTDPAATVFVAPDSGAIKATFELAKLYGYSYVRADKKRDLATGKILETVVYGDVAGLTCFILDDALDGGKTFIELAKVLKAKGARQVILYATHGMFTKGLEPLLEAGIDRVYTTTSYRTDILGWPEERLTVLDLDTVFKP